MTQLGVSFLFPDFVNVRDGFQDAIGGIDPAGGQNFVWKVPGEFYVVPLLASYTLAVNNALKGSAQAGFLITDANGVTITKVLGVTSVAWGGSGTQEMLPNVTNAYAVGNNNYMPLPQFVLAPGYSIQSAAALNDANDKISSVRLVVQKFSSSLTALAVETDTSLLVPTLFSTSTLEQPATATPVSEPAAPAVASSPGAAPAPAPGSRDVSVQDAAALAAPPGPTRPGGVQP